MLAAQFPNIYQGTAGRVEAHENFLVINIPRTKTEVLGKSPRSYKAELDLELSVVWWEEKNIIEELEEKAAVIYRSFERDRFLGGLARDSRLEETRFSFDDSTEQILGVCEIDYKVLYDIQSIAKHPIYSMWK
jgi:hypothetical protein